MRRGQVVVEDVKGGFEGGVQGQIGDVGGERCGCGLGWGCEWRREREDVCVEGGEGGVGGVGVEGGHWVWFLVSGGLKELDF